MDDLLTLDLPGLKIETPPPLKVGGRVWVWFRDPGRWERDFYVKAIFDDGMATVDHHRYWPATIATWRIRTREPQDLGRPPAIPRNGVWLIQPTRMPPK